MEHSVAFLRFSSKRLRKVGEPYDDLPLCNSTSKFEASKTSILALHIIVPYFSS